MLTLAAWPSIWIAYIDFWSTTVGERKFLGNFDLFLVCWYFTSKFLQMNEDFYSLLLIMSLIGFLFILFYNYIMLWTYKRKLGKQRYADYSKDELEKCLLEIRDKKLSIQKAAADYNIPISTIKNKLHKKKKEGECSTRQGNNSRHQN